MVCKKCSSENVQVIADTKGKTQAGFFRNMIRFTLIICTCGLWLLVPRGGGKIKTKTKAVCMNCSHQWYI
jgi:hypothetical protein